MRKEREREHIEIRELEGKSPKEMQLIITEYIKDFSRPDIVLTKMIMYVKSYFLCSKQVAEDVCFPIAKEVYSFNLKYAELMGYEDALCREAWESATEAYQKRNANGLGFDIITTSAANMMAYSVLDSYERNKQLKNQEFESFAWEEDSDYRYQKKFSDLKLEMEKLALENSFAQEFVEKAKSVPYDSYDEVNRLAFDSYVRLLFREGYYEITNGTLGKFQEAWSGDYIEENRLLLYARLEDEKYTSWNNSKYLRIWYDRNEDKVRTDSTVFDLSLQDNSTIQILQGDYFTKDVVAEIELEDVKEQLNKMLETNKGFFDYLMSYRDNVYSPAKNATLSAEKEKKDEQDRVDRALSKKKPQIGMSAEEVKKTKWGYPDKINKDTYVWGTTEQWVYSGEGYVYFENGVVTSISER